MLVSGPRENSENSYGDGCLGVSHGSYGPALLDKYVEVFSVQRLDMHNAVLATYITSVN
jgi:hypothetical protein